MKTLVLTLGLLMTSSTSFADVLTCESTHRTDRHTMMVNVISDTLVGAVQVANAEGPVTWVTGADANPQYVSQSRAFEAFNQFDVTHDLSIFHYSLMLPKTVLEMRSQSFKTYLQVGGDPGAIDVISFSCRFN
jgi:hypothetical protein